jgi:parallel beta-helix repeat protein
MVSRGVTLLIVVTLSLAILVQTDTANSASGRDAASRRSEYVPSYVSHEPFNITSDMDFETQSWPGNGSESNPYIIENINITSEDSACIWIMNTTRHFVVRNCLFASPVLDNRRIQYVFSITLTNVTNGVLYGNQWKNSSAGISGYGLDTCTISSNLFNVTQYGIMIMRSNHTIIFNNTQEFDNCYYGIVIHGGIDYTVYQNKFGSTLAYGISAWSIFNSSIYDNSFSGSDDQAVFSSAGIELWGSSNCNISKNEVANFDESGLSILYGVNHKIEENNVTMSQSGISILSIDCIVRRNNLVNNSIGVDLVNANNTQVCENSIRGRYTRYGTGISIHGGFSSDIYTNSISHVAYGIVLQGGEGLNISYNSVTDSRYGFAFGWYSNWYSVPDGPSLDCSIIGNSFDAGGLYPTIDNYDNWDFNSLQFLENTVNGRQIGFFAYLQNESVNGNDFGQLHLVSCRNVTIHNGNFWGIRSDFEDDVYYDPGQATAITLVNCTECDVTNVLLHDNTIGITFQYSTGCLFQDSSSYYHTWAGVILWHSHNIVVLDVNVGGNLKGISTGWSWTCVLRNCLILGNGEAINLISSANMTLAQNIIFQNNDAIFLGDSDGCYIHDNIIYINSRGIQLNSSSDCLITGNNIHSNTGVGISLDLSSNRNNIFENVLAHNSPNAICEGSSNHWDNQVDTGNWWSDYNGTGPYIIDVNDQDNYPNWNETTSRPPTVDHSLIILPAGLFVATGLVVGIIALILVRSERKPEIPID